MYASDEDDATTRAVAKVQKMYPNAKVDGGDVASNQHAEESIPHMTNNKPTLSRTGPVRFGHALSNQAMCATCKQLIAKGNPIISISVNARSAYNHHAACVAKWPNVTICQTVTATGQSGDFLCGATTIPKGQQCVRIDLGMATPYTTPDAIQELARLADEFAVNGVAPVFESRNLNMNMTASIVSSLARKVTSADQLFRRLCEDVNLRVGQSVYTVHSIGCPSGITGTFQGLANGGMARVKGKDGVEHLIGAHMLFPIR